MGQLSGDISLMPLSDLLVWLANRQMNGLLVAELGTVHKELTIEHGSVVRASSNEPREHFGQFLIHFGLVSEEQLRRAFATQMETQVRLGKILVMIEAISEERVVQVLKVKIAETALDSFRWATGRFFFSSDPRGEEPRHEVRVSVPLLDIHREGVARSGTWDQYYRVFPNPQHVLYLDETRIPAGVPTDPLDERILSLARQGISIEALALELHATDYQMAVRLYDLHRAGIVHAREPSVGLPSQVMIPAQGRTHADLAREAIASDAYGQALEHVERGARQNPDDPSYGALKEEVHVTARQKMERELARYAVPTLVRELSAHERKRFSAKERYLLARIDGCRTVDAIIQLSPMHDIEALEILRRFKGEGLIKL